MFWEADVVCSANLPSSQAKNEYLYYRAQVFFWLDALELPTPV
jgi:hypothetical protein